MVFDALASHTLHAQRTAPNACAPSDTFEGTQGSGIAVNSATASQFIGQGMEEMGDSMHCCRRLQRFVVAIARGRHCQSQIAREGTFPRVKGTCPRGQFANSLVWVEG